MRSVKALREEIHELANEAKWIFDNAVSEGRDMTAAEDRRFKAITKKEPGGLIYDLQQQAEEADEQHRNIAMQTSNRPRPVLPVNGKLVEENDSWTPPATYLRNGRLKAFKSEEDAFNCGQFLKAICSREFKHVIDGPAESHCNRLGWNVTNAQTEGSGVGGGYTVPQPLAQTIIDVRESVGVARRAARILPMTSETLDVPRRDGGLTVYYPGEATTITTSDKSWGRVSFVAKKRAVANQISQELQDDSLISIVDDAVSEMAYALADKEDDEFINGDGTSTYGGESGLLSLLGSAGVHDAETGRDTWPELEIDDFTNTMALLPDKYARAPVWICSRQFYFSAMVRIMVAAGGGNTVQILQAGDGGTRSFLGYPVFLTDKMPKTSAASTVSCLFGTFSQGATIGDRSGISVGRSDDYAFLDDVTTLKATARYDINVHAPGDSSDPGAYVALKTAS